jgi:hypothetical protein
MVASYDGLKLLSLGGYSVAILVALAQDVIQEQSSLPRMLQG